MCFETSSTTQSVRFVIIRTRPTCIKHLEQRSHKLHFGFVKILPASSTLWPLLTIDKYSSCCDQQHHFRDDNAMVFKNQSQACLPD
ncbi:hypothetical protein Plhal703r1_c41g0140841 [Plasmopara halstedii]